jgi:BirA family transcriptional regulator, biotin operon repressor / biotin---[acetyl-CoA-carboxylase] ligase
MQGAVCLDVEALRSLLGTQFVGVSDRLVYVPEVESTNALAMHLARERPEEGLVVLTDSQTAGKGRQGRRWVDTPGCSVLSSIFLLPQFSPHLLVMIASLAVVEAIAQTSGFQATIKWPNDVLIGDRKVCGILIETSHNSHGHLVAILGIGINVNGSLQGYVEQKGVQVELTTIATTLEMACGYPIGRERLLAHLLFAIEKEYLALQQEAIEPPVATFSRGSAARLLQERWQSYLSTLGRTVQVHQGDHLIEGVAEAVDDNGGLLLRRYSGELVCITWGVVEHSSRLATYPYT